MKEELKGPKVENVSIAVVFEEGLNKETVYNVYLINENNYSIEGALVSSKGYGLNHATGLKVETSTLRHSLGDVKAKSYIKIEPIMAQLFGLSNEYWLSFWQANTMYDKKFVFVAESISEANCVDVPLINLRGVLIK